MCIWPDYYGIAFRNPRRRQLSGIEIDLSAQFAQDPRARVEYLDSSFGTLADDVKGGRIDVFMTGRLEGAAKRNVLVNAIKFAPLGTTIMLVAQVGDNGGAQISVRDHGPGIPPQELENIFDAFVQSSETKDGSGGTGLGLAICRKIIDAHGGSISAENMPGRTDRLIFCVTAACQRHALTG